MERKSGGKEGVTQRPVPMKLFSSWEVDRTPANCIPRLCSLTLTRLVVVRPLPTNETSSIIIAVKMAGSRRTLRSNEIPILDNGLISTDLELHFSLQYPHFLKREENRLLIMLQRRKKYKNRTILGYKTLAEGTIDMALVLQRSYLDLELGLSPPDGGNKENAGPLAKVTITGISSQPVDDLEGERKSNKAPTGRQLLSSPLNPVPPGKPLRAQPQLPQDFSDEEDDFSSHSSDSPQDEVIMRKNSKGHPHNRNLKQKIVNLLKKFKQTEEAQLSRGAEGAQKGGPVVVADIDDLFDELENLSDSEPDADTLSVGSFPKPVLPPFFASSKSLVQYIDPIPEKLTSDERGDSDSWTEPDQHSGESPKLHMKSPTDVATPPMVTLKSPPYSPKFNLQLAPISDQLSKVLPPDDGFPDIVYFVQLENGNSGLGAALFSAIHSSGTVKVLGVEGEPDLKVAFPHLVGKVQKFCNNNAKTPPPVTVVVVGTDSFLSAVTKQYVTQLSQRPSDWLNYFNFVFAPFSTGSSIWRLLCSSDPQYQQRFNDYTERGNPEEIAHRILTFSNMAKERRHVIPIPIAEAMITYKESEESCQVFVPFIGEVRLSGGYFSHAGEGQEDLSSSPPSPPHTPREEPLELQVDFWKGTVKSTVKAYFRSLSIQRTMDNGLSISYILKEKKQQKIMRLGKKKERDEGMKNLTTDGISRLVCLSKSQSPIKLQVDGADWPGVKFFQVSAQWQSQVKTLPLLVSSHQAKDPS